MSALGGKIVVFYQMFCYLCYSILFSLLFALLLRGKEKFPNVRKISFPLERIMQEYNGNVQSSGFQVIKNSPAWHGICGVSVYFVCVCEREDS